MVDKEQLVSKNFHGKTGKAYLFNQCINVDFGPEKNKVMMTGLHTVKSVICKCCRQVIGWTYVYAYEESEKYKEGKFIVEREYMAKNSKNIPEYNDDDEEIEEDPNDDDDQDMVIDDNEEIKDGENE